MNEVTVGDCREAMAAMAPASVDAIVTDPPAGIGFMQKNWDSDRGGRDEWIDWLADVLRGCLRVAKPGAHALVWALPRTSGWTHRALEDAGWEVRDCITHLFATGFPKSLDISKAIDKAAGAKREVVGSKLDRPGYHLNGHDGGEAFGRGLSSSTPETRLRSSEITAPATDLARQWEGWGTALKPAAEFWYLARKPLAPANLAANVAAHGTGALNIDGCRIDSPVGATDGRRSHGNGLAGAHVYSGGWSGNYHGPAEQHPESARHHAAGRWPANVVLGCTCDGDHHDPDCAVARLDAQSGERKAGSPKTGSEPKAAAFSGNLYGDAARNGQAFGGYDDAGGASRFFYCAKASRAERNAGLDGTPERVFSVWGGDQDDLSEGKKSTTPRCNVHPCVKPLSLMRWLVRLVTPPGGLVLDPFAGSGSTGVACVLEGFRFVGIDQDPEYVEIARRRIAHAAGPLFAEALT